MDYQDLEDHFEREYRAYRESIKKPNILLVGATGAGKSSLINTIFGRSIASSGAGRPVSRNIQHYHHQDLDVVLYDSRGYEVGEEKISQFKTEVLTFIKEREKSLKDAIHLVWYCISASNHRVTDLDKELIEGVLSLGLPLAIIFTQCDRVTEEEILALEHITRELKTPSFRVTIHKRLHYLQLYDLLTWSVEELSDDLLKRAFISSQMKDLRLKKREALRILYQHVGGSAFVGFTPIPFSDAPLLVANQMGMVARILHIYGLQDLSQKIPFLVKKLKIGTLLSLLGKKASLYLTGQMMKLFPGFGSLAGGLINASVASAITIAIGKTVSQISYLLVYESLQGKIHDLTSYLEKNEDRFEEILHKNLREEFKKR